MTKQSESETNLPAIALTVLRVLIGWHFLFEGISKLATSGWSSASYLMESKWFLSGFFHWIISDPAVLAITDFLNVWGLILIGLALFIGMFTRWASIFGAVMVLLYYVANPPFIDSGFPSHGEFFFINLNLVEAGILFVFAFLKKDYLWGLDRLFSVIKRHKEKLFPAKENHEAVGNTRREIIKDLASIPLLGVAFFGMAKRYGWFSFEEDNLKTADAVTSASRFVAKTYDISELKGKVPKGKIKHVEMSRIIPGGNLIAGFAHARDLIYMSDMIKNYFTDEKVIETLWICEACGMNTAILRTDRQTIRILEKYRKRGGKIQWLAQTYPKDDDFSNIQLAIDHGAVGAFVMGNIADQLIHENRPDQLARQIEFIKSQGLIAGTAGHAIQVPMACVKNGIEVDFFMKTFHHDRYWSATPPENRNEFMDNLEYGVLDRNKFHDNIWCASADEVRDFFRTCKTPWIGYKVLAAGAIKPEDGFRYAFENGTDFICVGMFDFQVIANANIIHDIFDSKLHRERGWYA